MDVRVEPLHSCEQFRAVELLQVAVWGMPDREVVPAHQLLAVARTGGLVLGAFAGDLLVGFSYGFPAVREAARFFYSHMTGVLPEWQSRHVGFALKCAQRAWALEQGYDRIVWTYDPLQARNAHFNLHRLGAEASRYYVNYYGEMPDALNRGLESDRLEVDWWIARDPVRARLEGRPEGPPPQASHPVLEAEGELPGPVRDPRGRWVRIAVCASIRALLEQDPYCAHRWRLATRQAFQRCFAARYVAVDFVRTDRGGWYLLEARA